MEDTGHALYSAEQVRELDRRAIADHGIPGYTLMQRAALACWKALTERWPQARSICVVCGAGNNGGDGYEIARLARAAGWRVHVLVAGKVPTSGDAGRASAAWQADGGVTLPFDGPLPAADIVVDALFGTGLKRQLDAGAIAVVNAINAARGAGAKTVAVDLPSGLDASTGTAAYGAAVQADLTVSFIGRKFGLYTAQGPQLAGERVFDSLDLPAVVYAQMPPLARLQMAERLRALLPRRARTAHKGDHGHVLLVGGNHGMAGAVLLAARAALRAGAGLVSVATRPEHAAALTAAQPELMCRGIAEGGQLRALVARADIIAIGPGLGTDEWARALWSIAIDAGKPLLLDADALNLLAAEPAPLRDAVLTPHPGEAGRLLGMPTAQVQADRLAALRGLEQRYGAAIVLKGAGSLASGAPAAVCPYGNPGMAVGGMGDVLSGLIAALRAQGLDARAAAQAGMLAHALAGDLAAAHSERGLLPSDLIDHLRDVLNP